MFLFFWAVSILFVKWRKLCLQHKALELAAIVRPQAANALHTDARNLSQHLLKCRVNARRIFIRHRYSPSLLGEEVDGSENPFIALVRLVGEQGGKVHGNLFIRRAGCGASAYWAKMLGRAT